MFGGALAQRCRPWGCRTGLAAFLAVVPVGVFAPLAGPVAKSDPVAGPVLGSGAASLRSLVPHAAGVFRAEVASIVKHDARPNDGDLFLEVKLDLKERTGRVMDKLGIVLETGGFTYDNYLSFQGKPIPPRPKPLCRVRAEDLAVGRTYWFVSASPWDNRGLYPQGLVGFWPDGDSIAGPLLAQAVKEDAYRWQPQLHQPSGLTFGWMADSAAGWRFRAWRDERFLWERALERFGHDPLFEWGVYQGRSVGLECRTVMPDTASILGVEVRASLDSSNAFHLPPGTYRIRHLLDVRTGNTLGKRVRRDMPGDIECAYQQYEPTTGRLLYERITDFLVSGAHKFGLAGGQADIWLRRIERTYDPRRKRLIREEVFGSATGSTSSWTMIEHDDAMRAAPPGSTHAR